MMKILLFLFLVSVVVAIRSPKERAPKVFPRARNDHGFDHSPVKKLAGNDCTCDDSNPCNCNDKKKVLKRRLSNTIFINIHRRKARLERALKKIDNAEFVNLVKPLIEEFASRPFKAEKFAQAQILKDEYKNDPKIQEFLHLCSGLRSIHLYSDYY